MDPVFVDGDRDFVAGRVGPVGVSIWHGATTDAGVRGTTRMIRDLVRSVTGRTAVMTVVEAGAQRPQDRHRKQIAEVVSEHVSDGCAAMVVEATGFAGIALRSVITALYALSRVDHPIEVCSSVEEAAGWLASQVEGVDGRALAGAVEALRRKGRWQEG